MAASLDPADVLAGLDPEQREVACAVRGPVCVLAGAGTGKTRAITSRIGYGVASGAFAPHQVLAVTFTARAAGEMRERLARLGVQVQTRTFHAAALRQLGYFWPRVVGGRLPRLVESKARLVAVGASAAGLRPGQGEVRDLAAEVEWAKVSLAGPDDYERAVTRAGRVPPRPPAEVAAVYAAYERAKRDAGALDFEDLLLLTAAVLDDHRDVTEEVRARYRHFVVDEYQDVNPLQQRLLDAWLGERDDVCVVGDPNQTIYSFTGASPSYLLGFAERFPHATVLRLVRDYRSTPQVVALANRLIGPGRHVGALVAQRPDGPAPTLTEYADEDAEAAAVAERCRVLLAEGVAASQIAVLFRTNGQSETYEQALAAADVPYQLRGGERFFDRPEVREAMLLLRGAARGVGDEPLTAATRHVLAGVGWSPGPPAGGGVARARWESLAALVRLADDQPAATTLEAFVTLLADRAAAQHAPTVEGVTLASLHAAKGLEWDCVFVVGLVEGMVPISYATTPEQVAEERRLLYVGVTRARVRLALSWFRARTAGGRGGRSPSRFLEGLHAGTPAAAAGRGRATGQPRGSRHAGRRGPIPCRVCGRPLSGGVERKLGRCASCPVAVDEALLERLRGWRLAKARELAQPAFCVFTDATLQAIAEARPRDARALLAVPGVGRAKLDRFGADLLALCDGDQGTEDAR
ncbi:MAG TPA: ATP-dependent DNA helicase UvrD2 [Mycobacteriales bacterium]|nr:ATP-dependent DNA helicase UvrD2 [Mycobacteriales bacterium]